MDLFSVITLFGGLTFFLYGMNVMSANLEKISGGKLETMLRKVTSNPAMSMLLGAVITISMQSSSAVTVMLVGLVNSGIMLFSDTVTVIFGAHIGTTFTAWILSLSGISTDGSLLGLLKPEYFSLIFAFVGIIYIMFSHSDRKKRIGTVLVAFAILMYGMELMKDSMAPLSEMQGFSAVLTAFKNPVIALLAAAVFTGIIQSSAASIGILQALSAGGGITCAMAIPIVMGQNIGTCATALISCIGTDRKAQRVAVINLLITVSGSVILLCVFSLLNAIFRFAFAALPVNAVSIALIHTTFNVLTAAILMPMRRLLIKASEKIMPDKPDSSEKLFVSLDERLINTPVVAVSECGRMVDKMAGLAHDTAEKAIGLIFEFDEKAIDEINKVEDLIDMYEDRLGSFLVKLSSKGLSAGNSLAVGKMLHAIGDFERLSDHAVNLTENARELHDKQISFSEEGTREVKSLSQALNEILDLAINSIINDDAELASRVEPLEEVIDYLITKVKGLHVKRLQSGKCTIEMGFVLSDILTNFERISDHCSNIAVAVIEAKHDHLDAHEYLNEIKSVNNEHFRRCFDEYMERYDIPD
ncbi:MAG: Na/Pi cotransporter family protein [Oscillospiraceae bacterium]|nr:Na/Pi cotransporter family protein [Oscillospiraceae bacterium]